MRFRKTPKGETLSEKAHNLIMTTQSISSTLSGQGIDTEDANRILLEAKNYEMRGDYNSAIEGAEAAKVALLRAKREHDLSGSAAPAVKPSVSVTAHFDQDMPKDDMPLHEEPETDDLDLSKLPKNYMQAKFMLTTAKALLDKNGIKKGEAYSLYEQAKERFDAEDYSKALSLAIKSEQMLDSDAVSLIGEEEDDEEENVEVEEVLACPSCEAELNHDDAFCRKCGEKIEFEAVCPECDAEVEPDDRFCRKCGQKLG